MPAPIIDNPVINSPFEEPKFHFKFDKDQITEEIVEGRRRSTYFIPIPAARVRGGQTQLTLNEMPNDELHENELINGIRALVKDWRDSDYGGLNNPVTRRLLTHWNDPHREQRLFFCQIEAVETAIFVAEASQTFQTRSGQSKGKSIQEALREANESSNSTLHRLAFKMATGSGKTTVMAMLMAWQTLNKVNAPTDARFSKSFLIVTPGITIKDRLRVLYPNDPDNYYKKWDIVPDDIRAELNKMTVVVTNYHALLRREKTEIASLNKAILLNNRDDNPFTETWHEMVNRVCRAFGNRPGPIVVLNDEAHHCYRGRPEPEPVALRGDERKEADKRDKAARVWISGLEAINDKIGVNRVFDLSATPFFLRGSGYNEGTLFPWVVSDFSLIDAIESGIVKVPRVPVSDNAMTGDQPIYRDLWLRIKDGLPRAGRRTVELKDDSPPALPVELEGALHSLYDNYVKYYKAWEQDTRSRESGQTPPVFIVVCNNTSVSKLIYDYVSGWKKPVGQDVYVPIPGKLALFSNVDGTVWTSRPNTILIDSEQLESGEAMSKDFKDIARQEIDEFKSELRLRFPGRNVDDITDEDLLREVMNTVGKPGKLGEHVKCVISVSMLTEGWDANTVTHILGVRAFGTQLLCEQVVGRGLRRRSYAEDDHTFTALGKSHTVHSFRPEYAEVYGVPFNFIHSTASGAHVETRPVIHVRALAERREFEMTFPRVIGYRHDLPHDALHAEFTEDSHLSVSTKDLATSTEMSGIVGETVYHDLEGHRKKREREVAFHIAKTTLEKYFRDDERKEMTWFFPSILEIVSRWLKECVHFKDDTFVGMLMMDRFRFDAADRIYRAIVRSSEGKNPLLPILRPYEFIGSTRFVSFETTKEVFSTRKSHVSHVVADSSWEPKMAQVLEDMPEVKSYVKNKGLFFFIPYSMDARMHNYEPDYLVRIDDGKPDLLNLIIEVSGEARRDKEIKVATARTFWIPAINNHGDFGRWAFIEILDPWDAEHTIQAMLNPVNLLH